MKNRNGRHVIQTAKSISMSDRVRLVEVAVQSAHIKDFPINEELQNITKVYTHLFNLVSVPNPNDISLREPSQALSERGDEEDKTEEKEKVDVVDPTGEVATETIEAPRPAVAGLMSEALNKLGSENG